MSRVAVVTGGASGIGLGVARQFIADGHRVALVDRDGPAAEQAAAELGADALAVEMDVADRASVDAGFEQVRAELGPVEILVTSAGIESFDSLLDITAEKWDRIIAVNLTGTFTCVQACGARHARRRLGAHRHHLVVERPVRRAEHGPLRGVEGRGHRAHQGAGERAGPLRDHREHHPAEPGRHPDGPEGRGGRATSRVST